MKIGYEITDTLVSTIINNTKYLKKLTSLNIVGSLSRKNKKIIISTKTINRRCI